MHQVVHGEDCDILMIYFDILQQKDLRNISSIMTTTPGDEIKA
jgi:hypothetical protein